MTMSNTRIVGIVLLVAGALGLAYGSFSYTKETHEANIGPLELTIQDRESVKVPIWLSIGVLVAGGLLLAIPKKT
jgi:hypothetical protein